MSEKYIRKSNVECAICNKPIYRRPNSSKRGLYFCSNKCNGIADRKFNPPCPICGKVILKSQHTKTCSRACANKNRKGITYDGLQSKSKAIHNYTLRTKLIKNRGKVCEICSHDNLNILQAHHIIEKCNGGNDDLTNLKLLCPNCHCTEHLGDSRLGTVTQAVYEGALEKHCG